MIKIVILEIEVTIFTITWENTRAKNKKDNGITIEANISILGGHMYKH